MTALSAGRRRMFLTATLLFPVLFFSAVEGVLRLTWPAGAAPAFDPVTVAGQRYLASGHAVARRYFAGEANPPQPPVDLFLERKPSHGFRLFVLGESTAAGFPYPHNGTFSRVLRDALTDVLPGDTVEVVNLAIAATNSFTLVDLADDVIAAHPDAVLIYAGHNEYYGALGVGSTIHVSSRAGLVRAYLAAERLRTVMLIRHGVTALQRLVRHDIPDSAAATFMESVARDQAITFGSDEFDAGVRQLAGNLDRLVRRFKDAGVRVYIASIASNVRDQPPLTSPLNGPARAAFDSAASALARGDSASAERLYHRARDLDVVRFRAPTAFNDVIRRAASVDGARYVPVSERFEELSPARSPGRELFLEHVHPTRHGDALIAESFFEALRADGFLGRHADVNRLDSWMAYEARMALSPFDERVALHTVLTVTTRWPFVAREDALDYRGSYHPSDVADSLALLVSRGGKPWTLAKLQLGESFEARRLPDSATLEYRGLMRDRPESELPFRLAGRALANQGRLDEATKLLERAAHLAPTWEADYLLGMIATRRQDYSNAIVHLDRAVERAPTMAAPAYRLSIAFALSRNLAAARGAAARAAQLDPSYPGLVEWMRTLGMRAP